MIILKQSYNQFMRRKEDLLYLDRIKCRWVEESERPTKYFLNLEKKNYNKKNYY